MSANVILVGRLMAAGGIATLIPPIDAEVKPLQIVGAARQVPDFARSQRD